MNIYIQLTKIIEGGGAVNTQYQVSSASCIERERVWLEIY